MFRNASAFIIFKKKIPNFFLSLSYKLRYTKHWFFVTFWRRHMEAAANNFRRYQYTILIGIWHRSHVLCKQRHNCCFFTNVKLFSPRHDGKKLGRHYTSNVWTLTLCSRLTCTQNHVIPSLNYKQYKRVDFMFWEDIWKSSVSFDYTKKPDKVFPKFFPFFWALLSDFEVTHKHGIYCYNKFRPQYQ